MKIPSFFVSLLFAATAFSQVSFDFTSSLPPDGKSVASVSKSQFGIYSSDSVDIDYEFKKEGVFAVSTIYNSISRETIRESSKFHVENGFLFGVQEDSIPCFLEGEYYHFGVMYHEQIIGGTSKNTLVKVSETIYIINFEDQGHFTPSKIEFKGKNLTIQHFSYESDSEIFDGIQERTENSTSQMQFVSLHPTLLEWNALNQDELFGEKLFFER